MAKEARINSRIDCTLKQEAEAILDEHGIKPTQAIIMLYSQIRREHGLPLNLKIPNDETIEAIEELQDPESRKKLKKSSNVEELMQDLNLRSLMKPLVQSTWNPTGY